MTRRKAHRAHHPERRRSRLPVIPGVLPDSSAESLQRAMTEAHEILPHIPGTQVVVSWWPRREGLDMVTRYFPHGLATIVAALDAAGPNAVVTFCGRQYHHEAAG